MLKTIAVAARDHARLAEISSVAARFGIGMLIARMGLESGGGEAEPIDLPRRTRQAIEALGPTYVKLGQILATRRDLLPDAWIEEFEHLHSQAPTLPFDMLREQVEAALGEPPEQVFARFDPEPLAAASIAQVHRARTQDGREVVLKIRRPGIRRRMEADLRLIRHLAGIVEASSREARRFQPAALVQQLAQDLFDELDFTIEGRNADRLRADFARDPRVAIPEIHWQWTSDSLLVMDHVAGVPPRDGETLRAAGIDPAVIAELGADLVLEMVLVHGRFHGDPHPGNLLCLPSNRLALLDLGLIGHVSPRRQQEFLGFILALRSGDSAALADTLALWSAASDTPRERILAASERLAARHGGGPLVLGTLVADFFPLLRQEGLVLPPDLLLIFKALVTMDGVLSAIQPGFDLAAALERAKGRLMLSRLLPGRSGEALLLELGRLRDDAPRLIRALARKLESEPAPAPEPSAPTIARAIRWLAASALASAALIAAALLVR
ncbi:AarF/UbiB family protein [Sphingomonas sp. dw_22]|uniref:ABC1 kinase family protein n=1 Tax=Sphingomonas sp. dw_22 TaxID=2721175 RepID=UPI001BD1F1FF|nr:AarF/UbiB family protein [Sphingomonas sp. dw_22]